MSAALTSEDRASLIASGLIQTARKIKPAPQPRIRKRLPTPGRKQTLAMIESELRERIKHIERQPEWKSRPSLNAAHFAYSESARIVQSYTVVSSTGKPVGGAI